MKLCIVVDKVIPADRYGGTERVVTWLGRGLQEMGHEVAYLARKGSKLEFAPVDELDVTRSVESQAPFGTDLIHLHSDLEWPQDTPACMTRHGNTNVARTFHPNTIFVSRKHAEIHGARAFVNNGLDPRGYGEPAFEAGDDARWIFLGKAAWSVKNVRGAIDIARGAGHELDVLGGSRLNFKMGFRFTPDRHVHFHGMVGGEEKYRLMRRARGLLFPVLWHEPAGLAIIESMYFGLPVLATPYGSLPEHVTEEVGVLSNNLSELVEAARDHAKYDRRAIHEHWRRNFTHRHMAGKYATYYERILAGEDLHPAPIESPVVRQKKLFDWLP